MNKNTKKKLPLNLVMLGLVSFFTDASSEMIFPLIPIFVTILGSGAVILGIIEGVAETTASMLKLATGIASDKFKKKKIFVLLGYTISSLVRPLTGIVSHAWQIVFVRMLDRTGKGIRTAPRDALIAASVDESIRGKAYGFHRAMDHTGAVVGPLLAIISLFCLFAFLKIDNLESALRWTFALGLIPGMIAVIIVIFFVKEKSSGKLESKPFRFSLKNFDKNFKVYLFIVLLFTLGNSSDAFLLFRTEEAISKSGILVSLASNLTFLKIIISKFGTPEQQAKALNILALPLVWSLFHIFKAVLSTPLGSLSDRIGRKRVISMGWLIYMLVYIGFAFLDRVAAAFQLPFILILFLIYSFYYALTEGAEKAFVVDLVDENLRGSAFGIFHFTVGIGALPASIIFGIIYNSFGVNGGMAAFGFGAALAGLSFLLLTSFVKEKHFKF